MSLTPTQQVPPHSTTSASPQVSSPFTSVLPISPAFTSTSVSNNDPFASVSSRSSTLPPQMMTASSPPLQNATLPAASVSRTLTPNEDAEWDDVFSKLRNRATNDKPAGEKVSIDILSFPANKSFSGNISSAPDPNDPFASLVSTSTSSNGTPNPNPINFGVGGSLL